MGRRRRAQPVVAPPGRANEMPPGQHHYVVPGWRLKCYYPVDTDAKLIYDDPRPRRRDLLGHALYRGRANYLVQGYHLARNPYFRDYRLVPKPLLPL